MPPRHKHSKLSGFLHSRGLKALFFPFLFVWSELLLHIHMGCALRYAPIYTLFGLSAGFLFSFLFWPRSVLSRVLTSLAALLVPLVYIVEMIAKNILQAYYPPSILGTAMSNRLSDYSDAIAMAVRTAMPTILLMLLPSVLFLLFAQHGKSPRRRMLRLVLFVSLHLAALLVVFLPWKGDLTPAKLYRSDTGYDDQVEQLGLASMLRLDVKHMIFPVTASDEITQVVIPIDPDVGGDMGEDVPAFNPDDELVPEDPVEELPTYDTSPNVMDVDLAAIAAGTDNANIKWLAQYFDTVTPTNKNAYTGMFEGCNVIFLTLEGISGYVLSPEYTPTLWKLAHEGFVFNNYYTALHFTSTSNGECQHLLGLYPKDGSPISLKRVGALGTNCYFSLAQQLGRLGYANYGFHNNYDMYGRAASHTTLGYDWRYFRHGLELETDSSGERYWPPKDTYMIDVSTDAYMNSDTPFNVYYLTISAHTPYSKNYITKQYLDELADLPYSDRAKYYIASAMEDDRAFALLLERLEAAGKLDNTIIVASPDHVPYFDVDILEELTGETFGSSESLTAIDESNINFDVYKSCLILWSASMTEPVEVDKVCCQVDVLPTLSNLLGLTYDSRMLSGTDILSDSQGLVVFSSRSWRTDKGTYNRFTQKFTPAEGVEMTPEYEEAYVSAFKQLAGYRLDITSKIIESNFYNYVFGRK